VYEGGLARAQRSEALVQALGTPIEPGFGCTGSIAQQNDEGQAELSFSLHGPRGEARVKLEAVRELRRWEYRRLVAALPDGHRIDLLAAEEKGEAPCPSDDRATQEPVPSNALEAGRSGSPAAEQLAVALASRSPHPIMALAA
jgi:hypothetical protein